MSGAARASSAYTFGAHMLSRLWQEPTCSERGGGWAGGEVSSTIAPIPCLSRVGGRSGVNLQQPAAQADGQFSALTGLKGFGESPLAWKVASYTGQGTKSRPTWLKVAVPYACMPSSRVCMCVAGVCAKGHGTAAAEQMQQVLGSPKSLAIAARCRQLRRRVVARGS